MTNLVMILGQNYEELVKYKKKIYVYGWGTRI